MTPCGSTGWGSTRRRTLILPTVFRALRYVYQDWSDLAELSRSPLLQPVSLAHSGHQLDENMAGTRHGRAQNSRSTLGRRATTEGFNARRCSSPAPLPVA